MEQKAGAQIGRRAFIQSILILFALMIIAGILTRVIPAGDYTRIEVDGRETIDPSSFQFVEKPDYPIWRGSQLRSKYLAVKADSLSLSLS